MPLLVRSRYTIVKLLCCLTAATVVLVVFHHGVIGVKRKELVEDHAETERQWKVEKRNQTRGVNTNIYFNLTTSEASSSIAFTRNESKEMIDHNNRTDTPAVYRERSQLIERVCENHTKLFGGTHPTRNLLVDDKHRVLYCPLAKVANSNWRRVFLVLKGAFKDTSKIGVVYKYRLKSLQSYGQKEREYRLKHYTKFMFARHPFSRILSAYRDKFVEKPERSFVNSYVPKVKRLLGVKSKDKKITFSEFVQYLIRIDQHNYNPHWNLMYRFCQPCATKYDIIGNYETLNEDADYIISKINASKIVHFPNIVPHRTNSSSLNTVRRYFSELTKDQINKLYKKYELDFKFFGYKISDLLES